ncbi:MAG TPA: CpaF family protein, partial [Caulobacteraceae bacterium]|nr:CpaF family protein [Caulobacteraceae bacterium]
MFGKRAPDKPTTPAAAPPPSAGDAPPIATRPQRVEPKPAPAPTPIAKPSPKPTPGFEQLHAAQGAAGDVS